MPHRGASMFFGRNEENGLRCVYHGWKFDTAGACVDMPNEPAESNFKHKIKATAYPCRDVNGMIWAYMGPRAVPPPLPALEHVTCAPGEAYAPSMMFEENNWVQGVEGDIDTSHIDYLHAQLYDQPPTAGRGVDRSPRLEIVQQNYGACYAGIRRWDASGAMWYRISQFMMPFWTMIAAGSPDQVMARAWVPLDDTNTMLTGLGAALNGAAPRRQFNPVDKVGGYLPEDGRALSRYRYPARKDNDYLLDHEAQKTKRFSGIPTAGNLQDIAMTESMGPIYQRTREHLGTSDSMVIFVRRMLIKAAKDLRDHGIVPETVDNPRLYRVRSASIILPPTENWVEATAKARDADAGVPVSYVSTYSILQDPQA